MLQSGQYGNLFLIAHSLIMNAAQFNLLSLGDQESLVHTEGVFIAFRQEPEFVIKLYQFESFYVELFYHQVRKSPVSVRSFTNTNRLDCYLNGIDLGFI